METGLRRVGPWSVVIRVILEVLLGARACPNRPNAPTIGTQKAGPLTLTMHPKIFLSLSSHVPLSLSLSYVILSSVILRKVQEPL